MSSESPQARTGLQLQQNVITRCWGSPLTHTKTMGSRDPHPTEAGGAQAARPHTLGSMRRKLCGPRLLSVERLNVLLWWKW